MPSEIVPIREVERAVSRPIALHVIRELFPRWGMKADQTRLVMLGTTETIPTTHSTIHKELLPQRLFNDLQVTIEVEEDYIEYGAPYQPYMSKEAPPIFLDNALRLSVRPVYREVKCEINVTVEAKSRVHAQQLRRKMQGQIRSYTQYQEHFVDYHYQFQPEILLMLKGIYDQREENYGYGDSFATWFKAHVDNRITTNRNHGEKGHQFAIAEKQVSITGYYTFEDPPKVEVNEAGMKHSVSFSYSYTYMRPEHLLIYYPIAVHNQMLPDKFIDKEGVDDYTRYFGQTSWSNHGIAYLKHAAHFVSLYERVGGLSIPYYDDWGDFYLTDSFYYIMKGLLCINPEDPTNVLNLDQMGSWKFSPAAMRYIQRRGDKLFSPYESIFFFSLHEWENIKDSAQNRLENDFTIRHLGPRDPRKNYHFLFNLLTDPERLTEEALRDLLGEGELARDYLNIVYPGIGDHIGNYGQGNGNGSGGYGPNSPTNNGGASGNRGDINQPIYELNQDGSLSRNIWDEIIRVISNHGGTTGGPARHMVYASILTYRGDNNVINAGE